MTPEQQQQIATYAGLQFSIAETEVALGLESGAIDGEVVLAREFARNRIRAQAAIRTALFKAAQDGDRASLREFLALGRELQIEDDTHEDRDVAD